MTPGRLNIRVVIRDIAYFGAALAVLTGAFGLVVCVAMGV